MKIAVCMKQVPAYSDANMDEKTGVLIRSGTENIVNKYDLSALETALRIKEQMDGVYISVFTMGPQSAENVLKEAFAYGADKGFLICDKVFAGADVLATSYTLMQGIKSTGTYDLILCGKQTTDGDTAQVSGALAKWFEIPHVNWVMELFNVSDEKMQIKYDMGNYAVSAEISYPCLLSVEASIFKVRIPSLKQKLKSKSKAITIITLEDLEDQEKENYGLKGSATRVIKIFPPEQTSRNELLELDKGEAASYILDILKSQKVIWR